MQNKLEIGLIGNPCAGSLSPLLHNVLAKSLGIPLSYHLWEPAAEELPELLDSLPGRSLTGVNVTIPYKASVMASLKAASPLGKTLGAVNTLVNTPEGLFGANTDVYGFTQFLRSRGISLSGRCCLLLGAGGAAKAVAYAMASEGATVYVWNRNSDRGREFVAYMNGLFPGVFLCCGDDELSTRYYSLLVNTIPLRSEYENILLYDRISASLWVDINYSASGTPLGDLAAERGIAFADGKEMLFFQGLRSFEIWNGLSFGNRQKAELLETFLACSNRKIVLIGFMGSGKSTVSAQLAVMAGFERVSTDVELETRQKKSVAAIFAEKGEDFFRDAEQEVLAETLASDGPLLIDTGGGVIEREANRRAIQASGALVVWLDSDNEKLLERLNGQTARPLLVNKTEEERVALLERRRPLYEEIAHVKLDAAEEPLDLAKEIMKRWSGF